MRAIMLSFYFSVALASGKGTRPPRHGTRLGREALDLTGEVLDRQVQRARQDSISARWDSDGSGAWSSSGQTSTSPEKRSRSSSNGLPLGDWLSAALAHKIHYLCRPFRREPDFRVTSVN